MMQLQHITPTPELRGYIEKLWIFESSGRMPSEDMKLIVPNGMVKLVIPFRNGITGKYESWYHHSKESSLTLIGISDSPAIVDIERDAPHGNIGIEFSPLGAYRIFKLRQSDVTNKIFPLEDLLGKTASALQRIIAETDSIQKKLLHVQNYLVNLMRKSQPDLILDYCIREIQCSPGVVSVAQLEQKTGYSSRWLYDKFMEKVGLGPKSLSSVLRFMRFYQRWANNPSPDFFKHDMYQYFYDQAHFIKEFKRFTGSSPLKFVKSVNEFGRIFYKG